MAVPLTLTFLQSVSSQLLLLGSSEKRGNHFPSHDGGYLLSKYRYLVCVDIVSICAL